MEASLKKSYLPVPIPLSVPPEIPDTSKVYARLKRLDAFSPASVKLLYRKSTHSPLLETDCSKHSALKISSVYVKSSFSALKDEKYKKLVKMIAIKPMASKPKSFICLITT